METPVVRHRAAVVLLAVLALVAGLLAAQAVTAPHAAAQPGPWPVPGAPYEPPVSAQLPVADQTVDPVPMPCSSATSDQIAPLQSVSLLASPAVDDQVGSLRRVCAYPDGPGVPVALPRPTYAGNLVEGSEAWTPLGTSACVAPTPDAVGVEIRYRYGVSVGETSEYTGDTVSDLRLVCGAAGTDGRTYASAPAEWARGGADSDFTDYLRCDPGQFVDGLRPSSDARVSTDPRVYAVAVQCDAPQFDPDQLAATFPQTSPERLDSALGDVTGSDFIPAACGGGVVGTGLRVGRQANEGGSSQIGAVGVECTPLASATAPATLDPDATLAGVWPPGADPDETVSCPDGLVVTSVVGYGTTIGSTEVLSGFRAQCSELEPDGTTSYLDGEPVNTGIVGSGGGGAVGVSYCPADQIVTGLALALTDETQYGLTPKGLNLVCSALTLAPSLPAANSSWTTATELAPDATTTQALTSPGGALWFKVPTTPGSTVSVTLSGLPVDDDLSVFGDIGNAFLGLSDLQSLTRLSAEFAAVDVAPTTFSPTTFSPTTFSPTTFSPTTFSPTTFSPTTFSPTTFSPTTFSPTTFSPTTFSPTTFSPTTFSPTMTPEDYFKAGVFPDLGALADAFSSAQTRSLLAVSAHPGLTPETYSAPTWTRSGYTYLRVTARDGATSPNPVTLTVASTGGPCDGVPLQSFASSPLLSSGNPVPDSAGTVVLTDTGRFAGADAADVTSLREANAAFVTAAANGGALAGVGPVAVVDLANSPRVQQLQAQADAHPDCPTATNLAAQGIRDIVNAYRGPADRLAYVVIEGNDRVVPFFRYADDAGVAPESGYLPPVADGTASNASLRGDYVLGQDAYGALYDLTVDGSPLPVPDLAVGRVVESPTEIASTLQAFVAKSGGAITPTSTLSTGYDFLAAGAKQIAATFAAADAGGRNDTLVTDQGVDRTVLTQGGAPTPDRTWTAADLRTALLGSRHDVVYLAGHFSANAALAADYVSALTTRDLVAAAGSLFRDTLVFSAGCHSGYNLVDSDGIGGVTDPLDWAQALAQAGATLVAGTGYQYGDTDFVKYSNQLYVDFADALRRGTGPVAVGSALVQAKRDYLAGQPTLDGVDQKSLLQATVFGLPMQGVDFRTGRTAPPPPPTPVTAEPVTTQPGLTFGLQSRSVDLTPQLTTTTRTLTGSGGPVTATYLSGPGGAVEASPGQPTVPVVGVDATAPTGTVLRGVGFRSGTYTDTPGVTPLTGAPATETNTVHGPFVSNVFTPSRLATPNYFDALAGGGAAGATRLFVTPAQYRSDAPGSLTDLQRVFSQMGFVSYYSGDTRTFAGHQPAAAAPPSITASVGAAGETPGTVAFSTHVVGDPTAGVHGVWVTWTVPPAAGGTGTWQSVDLVQSASDSTLWTGAITLPEGASASDVRFLVQAVNGVGAVGVDDAAGAFHQAAAPRPAGPATLTLGAVGTRQVVAGGALTLTGRLTDGSGAPLAGRPVTFRVGAAAAIGVTDDAGVAQVSVPVPSDLGDTSVSASFDGDAGAAAAVSSPLRVRVAPRPTALGVTLTVAGYQVALRDVSQAANPVGVPSRTVSLVASYGVGTVLAVRPVVVDALGRGTVPASALPPGSRTVRAWFGSASTPLVGGASSDQTDPLYGASRSAAIDLKPTSTSVTGPATVAAGSPAVFVVTAAYPSVAGLDVTAQARLTVQTSKGVVIGGACTAGACTVRTAGSYVVTASYLGRPSSTTLTVTPAGAAVVRLTPATARIKAGGSQSYVVKATDAYGNPLPAGPTTVTIAPVTAGSTIGASCNGAVCTATVAGTYAVTATRGGVSGRATLTVVAGAAASVTALTGGNQSASTGATFTTPLTAQVVDLYGNPVAGVAVTFRAPAPDATTGAVTFAGGGRSAVARTGPDGVATAPALTAGTRPGPVTLTASVSGVPTPATFSVAVTALGPARADLTVSGRVTSTSATALTVTLTVRNAGPSAAQPVGIALWVARGGTVSAAPGGQATTPRLATFTVASLAAGAKTTVTVTVARNERKAAVAVVGGALSGVADPQLGDNLTVVFG